MQRDSLLESSRSSAPAMNKVLKNTYMLLSATLIFSAIMAAISMMLAIPYGASLACSIGALVLIWFVLPRTANSEKGILTVFAFTGLLGFGLGPMLNHYLAMANGGAIIAQALGGTGIIFLTLSAYVTMTKKDFSFLGGFLMIGMMVALVAIVANIFLGIPALSLAVSAAIVFIMSGYILYETSQIIHGGQTNYVLATASLYLSIYNIFVSLLQILGVMGDD
ncbi:Modulator of FtsH protease YccA [BD1-7 clade bacterium]|uniref:Modulator of FtsH protease YccA n=1 Tax=BD1-7 clade bacterium TaxID=2029982 RepID=A0A5S9QDP2_9GAMM|nr:Modulator of FtsH protease YccA [BD1-7 clade bacterium]CAA0115939.1 Modulator of FtsH protease YccA [BD1-7 clade bacterium]CAA0119597.1 Modulator of FtsH protease YccA [BD1-7 clade bacterium]